MEFSSFKVKDTISDYKNKVKAIVHKNKIEALKARKIISKDKIGQILKFWKENASRPLTIRDIKTGVWMKQQEISPSDKTISRALKSDLRISYRTLSTLHPKTQTHDHIRAYWEWVIIQSKFINNDWELVFIDEFSISSHRNKFKGWSFKDHKPAIAAKIDNFSMYFVIAVSPKHIYGILGNENANTSHVFIYFLDNLLKYREKLFEMQDENTVYVMDNASIHKTKRVDEYAKEMKIPL